MSRALQRGRRAAIDAAIDLVYPPQCVACGEQFAASTGDRALCGDCQAAIDSLRHPYCRRCGTTRTNNETVPCHTCAKQRFRFDRVVRIGPYEGVLRDYVLRMKHVADEPLCLAIARVLAGDCASELTNWMPDLVAPVPMFWLRRVGRRTSSAAMLASVMGRQLQVPVEPRLLVRRRNTLPQGDLTASQRQANVRGAFTLRRPRLVADRRILLVDDVLTSGATLNEASRVLRRGGACEIGVIVVARTEGPFV